MRRGKLYICPTPIGNLEDITLRTLKTLEKVDLIAAEDTRHTIKLLNHYDISKPLTSYHEHNMKKKGAELIERLIRGEDIALVSDAGMPGISDPGEDLIALAIEEDIEIVGLPGATASITSLVVSGLPARRFAFEGFLSSKKKERREELNELKDEGRTIILYESPHRLLDSLGDILDIMGNRRIAIIRELTKLHEEVFRGKVEEALDRFSSDKIRGEFVLIIHGSTNREEAVEIDIQAEILRYIDDGFTKKDSIKLVSEKYNLPRNQVYKESLGIQRIENR